MGYLLTLNMCLNRVAVAWKDDIAQGNAFPPNAVLSSPACAGNWVCSNTSPGVLGHINRFWIILTYLLQHVRIDVVAGACVGRRKTQTSGKAKSSWEFLTVV